MAVDLRVELVDLVRMGRIHATNLAGRTPLAELVRIVDANEKIARDLSEQLGGIECSTSYADLLEGPEIEAVVVASPTPLHAEMAEAGKHVFCEKPLSLDLERTYQDIEAVRSDRDSEAGCADDTAAFILAKAAKRSCREERTIRLKSERRRIFYEEID